MTEKDIKLCGHGSGVPTVKDSMYQYLCSREARKTDNGLSKGLVCVRRFLTTDGQRSKFHDLYKTILGRNIYSQIYRDYVYTPRSNGNFYSDCSSSGAHTYEKCGIKGVREYNTAAMYYNGSPVDVKITNGHIAEDDLKKLKVGDALLFRGNDPSRPLQIGHVEYIYEIPVPAIWIKLDDGSWQYRKENGELAQNEWLIINRHWYYFGADARLCVGRQMINGKWYYLEEGGEFEGACWHESDERNGSLERWDL